MFAERQLNELRLRKEIVVARADVNRLLVRLHAGRVATSVRWVEAVADVGRKLAPYRWIAAPAAGYLLARRSRGAGKWFGWATQIWSLARWLLPRR
jgi:hypothetical protein